MVRPDLADPKMDLHGALYENLINGGDDESTEWNVRFYSNDDIQTFIFGHPSSGIRWALVLPSESDDDQEFNEVLDSLTDVLRMAIMTLNSGLDKDES